MATFAVTTSQNIDALSGKTGGDVYNINGGTLTIDQDSRHGLNQSTSASIGSITLSATLGGAVEFDARYVRLIPYNTGTGNVPASNTVISQGSASGLLIGVYSALNVAPTTSGSAMPASGFIKIKQWNSVAYAAGALTGIGATATGVDTVGWIEIVGDEAGTITANRLGLFRVRGEWYEIGTTDGNRATTYQIPSNGVNQYHAGVWVETGTASGVYEFYPCAGSLTATSTNMATDSLRGKACWISTAGLLRFGHDGTNSTGGYIVPSGRKIRIPNIFFVNCTTAARTANALPNATLATRMEFATTGGGRLEIDKASMSWYLNVSQAYSFNMSNTGICTAVVASEVATSMTWNQVGVGHEAANTQIALNLNLCFAGGTFTNCTFTRALQGGTGTYVVSISDISGFTFTDCVFRSLVKATNATTGSLTTIRANNCTWANPVYGGGRHFLTTVTNSTFTNTTYYDHPATTTPNTIGMYAYDMGTACANLTIEGISFGGLTMVQPYSGIVNIAAAGCNNIKIRNFGTYASPLELGATVQHGVSWSRTTTTATVTKTAHGLKVNDIIYVYICSDTTPIPLGAKTVASVPTADTFTFTATNSGGASGTLSYKPQVSDTFCLIAAGAAANNIKIQRCYTTGNRNTSYGVFSVDNSSKNIIVESLTGDFYTGNPTRSGLELYLKQIGCIVNSTAITGLYGTHFYDMYRNNNITASTGLSWTRSSLTITVTHTDHGMRTNDVILLTSASDTAAVPLGFETITVTGKDTFTFAGVASGATSGTLSYEKTNGEIGIAMNESTANTSNYYTIDSGGAAFTSAGGLYMPTVNDQITFTSQYFILGHKNFPKYQITLTGGGSINNFDITYDLDRGSGFSGSFKNLSYPRAGGGGSGGSTNVTMTSTTGVAVGDYVFGTGIAPLAKVTSITNSTTVVVDVANTGAVSGTLIFNQIPSEADLPSTGVKIKVRIKTTTTNSTAITNLYIPTFSDSTFRQYQYVLETVTVKVTVKDAVSLSAIQDARVYLTATGGGPSPDGTVLLTGTTDASGILQDVNFAFLGNQQFTGRVRKATSGTRYKTGTLTGTITSSGLDITSLLISDE